MKLSKPPFCIILSILISCSSPFNDQFEEPPGQESSDSRYDAEEDSQYDPFNPKPPRINLPTNIGRIRVPMSTDINAWLGTNSQVADQLVWYEEGIGWIPWPQWSQGLKLLLQDAYQFALNGTSIPPLTPPKNQCVRKDIYAPVSILTFEDARNLFFSQISWSILIDAQNLVPWNLSDLTSTELKLIFDGRENYEIGCTYSNGSYDFNQSNCSFKGIKLKTGTLTPAPGHWTYGLLLANDLIGSNRKESIVKLSIWITENFVHTTTINKTGPLEEQYQYRGLPPLVTLVETETKHEFSGKKYMYHCWGNTQFFKLLLSQINIPVERFELTYHQMPRFRSEGISLDHGDTPYSSSIKALPPSAFPYEEIFVEDNVFEEWFGPALTWEEQLKNVGRRGSEISVKHLTYSIVNHFCDDIEEENSMADGHVYANLKDYYTLAELNGYQLWQKLAGKLHTLEYGCDKLYMYNKAK